MKYLQDYINEGQTKAINKAGAFFAFSKQQFDEQKKDGVQYVSTNMGMLCPKDTIDTLLVELDDVYNQGIKDDIADNGLEAIIKRELNNHEAYYTGDIHSTADALADYPVTVEEISNVFNQQKQHANM